MEALGDIGLQTYLEAQDFVQASAREMITFCLYLYNTLPHYIPKTQIEFACKVKKEVVKHIELANPTNKSISYRVRLEGSTDFFFEDNERETAIEL